MKTILKLFVSIMILFGSVLPSFEVISADTSDGAVGYIFRDNSLVYREISDTEVSVHRCDKTISGELNIPSTVTSVGNKYKVTLIDDEAFDRCENLTVVTIPEGVTAIGYSAFRSCNSLTSVTIPKSVKTIKGQAFMWCSNLTNVELPDGLIYLESHVFYDCKKITSLKIPNSVTKIGTQALAGCSSLKSIRVPDNVTYIGNHCFENCENLETVVLPRNITTIPPYTFYASSGLKKVYIPGGVREIHDRAFGYCDSVTFYTTSSYAMSFATSNDLDYVNVSEYLPELQETMDRLSALKASDYSKSTYQVLQEALGNAEAAITNLNETDMRNATPLLLEAESQLFRIANYSEVDKAIKQADSLNPNDYYDFSKVSEAIDAVVREKGIDEQSVVDEYAKAINDAIANLELRPDTSKLDQAIKRASIYELNNLSPDSKSQYDVALANAKSVINNINATQEELDNAATALRNAINNIKSNMNFKDVAVNTWYSGVVEEAYARGLMKGIDAENTIFSPDKSITRGMVATVLYRMAGAPKVTFSAKFPDVKENIWYTSAIMWAVEKGIVNGYDNGKFGVDDNITRQDFIVMLYNYALKVGKLNANEKADLNSFKDVKSISPYALPSLQWAVANKLISGKENGTKVAPIDNATRAEAAKMFTMLQDLIIK